MHSFYNMGNGTFILTITILITAVAMTSGQCPENICSNILLSESCQSTVSYLVYKDQMCRQCDICLDRDTPTDTRGCPTLKCQPLTYKPGCTSKQYFLWNQQLCPDCDVDMCLHV